MDRNIKELMIVISLAFFANAHFCPDFWEKIMQFILGSDKYDS